MKALAALTLFLFVGCAAPTMTSQPVIHKGQAIMWLNQAKFTHMKYRLNSRWDSMWVDRYTKIIKLIEVE